LTLLVSLPYLTSADLDLRAFRKWLRLRTEAILTRPPFEMNSEWGNWGDGLSGAAGNVTKSGRRSPR
jgi:hypothetical protein